MSAHDIEKLLGGYMTGTLTDAEQSELMCAALDDQQLFNALADEEAMRDALADPVFRARLRARLAPEAAPPQRSLRWLWMLAPVLAASLALVFILNRPQPQHTFETVSAKLPQSPEVAPDTSRTVPPSEARRQGSAPAQDAVQKLRKQEQGQLESVLPPPAKAPPPLPPPSRMEPKPTPSSAGATAEFATAIAPPPPPPAAAPKQAAAPPPPPPAVIAEKKTTASKDEAALAAAAPPVLAKAAAETDALSAAALDLQVERSINGRFEATEIGALRQGDRVRFRVRAPESGTLVMTAGSGVARSTLAEAGRTYYLPDASGLPPGEATVEVAIALHLASERESGNALFRARQGAVGGVVGGVPAGARANETLRDARREDADKAKEQSVQTAGRVASVPRDQAVGGMSPAAPRQVRLRLEFKPR